MICYRGGVEVVLGLHDFDDFENGGQPEVFDVVQRVLVSTDVIIPREICSVI